MMMMIMMIRASSRRAYLAQLHAFIITRRYLLLRELCVCVCVIPFCCREKEEWRD